MELQQARCNFSRQHIQIQTEQLIALITAVIKHILSVHAPWLHTPQNQTQALANNVHPVLHTLAVMVNAPQSQLTKAVRKQTKETFAYCFTAKRPGNHRTEKLKVI